MSAVITRASGRRYAIKLEALDDESLARSSASSATSTTRSRWPCTTVNQYLKGQRGSSLGGDDVESHNIMIQRVFFAVGAGGVKVEVDILACCR
jgi:hypothetical protein